MTKTNNHNSKIVIIGPKTSIGQCILDQLAQLNISVTLIRPLDIHQEAGKVVYYANHRLITQPLDTFDFNTKHIIFVCDKKIIPLLCRRKRSNMNWWIDCTHSVHQAQCIIPSINGAILKKKHPKWICNPGSSVIALVQILVPILKAFEIQSIQLMMIMGTFFDNPQSSEKLIVQSRHFLTQTPFPEKYHFPQLAFNLIPDYFNELGSIIQRQLACFIKPYVYVHTCFAPVVRGCCLLVQLNLRKNYHTSRLLQKLNTIKNIQIIKHSNMIGLNDLITEDNVFVIHPTCTQNTLSFWCLQDAIQQGAGLNAAHLANLLIKHP